MLEVLKFYLIQVEQELQKDVGHPNDLRQQTLKSSRDDLSRSGSILNINTKFKHLNIPQSTKKLALEYGKSLESDCKWRKLAQFCINMEIAASDMLHRLPKYEELRFEELLNQMHREFGLKFPRMLLSFI
jgi:hypothetical protein